jgi:hypothetical protein
MKKRVGRPPLPMGQKGKKLWTNIPNNGEDVKHIQATCLIAKESDVLKRCVAHVARQIRNGTLKPEVFNPDKKDEILELLDK